MNPPDLLAHARGQFAAYLRLHPAERCGLQALAAQLEDGGGDLFSRANMRGHITTSGLVFDAVAARVLLIHHKTLDRWLQPGGHHEGSDSLLASAAREVAEETGVEPRRCGAERPFDVETHAIPANPAKGEGAHCHHDFIYLFAVDSTQPLKPQWTEVNGATWMDLEGFAALPTERFRRMAAKLKALRA